MFLYFFAHSYGIIFFGTISIRILFSKAPAIVEELMYQLLFVFADSKAQLISFVNKSPENRQDFMQNGKQQENIKQEIVQQIQVYIVQLIILIEIVVQPTSQPTLQSAMLLNRVCKDQTNSENLVITLRKLIVKDETLHNSKVLVVINVFQKQEKNSPLMFIRNSYRNSQPRPVKNGVACFYGESIVVTERVKAFNIIVQLVEDESVGEKAGRRELAKIEIGQDEINEINKKKCAFSSGSEAIQLIWEAKFQHERFERPEEYQDRSLQDFKDIEEDNKQERLERQLFGRKMYSPAIRGQVRKQRSSSRRKKDDARFELVSQSPHKLTMDTNQTLVSIKKRIKLMSPSKNKNENCGLKEFRREFQHESNKKQKLIEKQKQKLIAIQKEMKAQEMKAEKINFISIAESSPKKSKPELRKYNASIKSPLTPQHSVKNSILIPKKKSQKFYEKINLKSLLYTSVIGIIGGVAASQF